jgi:hypothetical protein
MTQGMLAFRQFVQGDSLSHRTLRLRQTAQLRILLAPEAEAPEFAWFSDAETEASPTAPGCMGDTCDMLEMSLRAQSSLSEDTEISPLCSHLTMLMLVLRLC